MLQLILATAAAFCFGKHTSYSDVRRPEPTWPGRSALACAVLSGLAGIIFGCAPVYARLDWYPLECCARNDCMPARGSVGDGRGGMTVIVEDLRIGIPEGVTRRPCLDDHARLLSQHPNEIGRQHHHTGLPVLPARSLSELEPLGSISDGHDRPWIG